MTGTRLRDAVLPAAVAVLGAIELYDLRSDGWGYGIALECAACALLVWRRDYPLVMCTLAAVLTMLLPWVGPQLDEPATPIFIAAIVGYSLARQLRDLRGLVGMGVMVLLVMVDYLLADSREHGLGDVVFVSALMLPPYVLGRLMRKVADQAEQLERQQELIRTEAVRTERARIARELHDVVAHSVSAMVVQTAAAQDLLRTDPLRVDAMLEDVAATGRKALSETGRLLHVIRDEADELGLHPAPGMAMLPQLVAQFRDSGLAVELQVDGGLRPLPVGLDVSAYRIVQEALTNALRYAADRTATLRLACTPTALHIRSSNRSTHLGGDSAGHGQVGGSGLGLVGMAERVALFGGTLSHRVTSDGRFELDAVLPLADGEPA